MKKLNYGKFSNLDEREIIEINGGIAPVIVGVIITGAITISIACYKDSMNNSYQQGVNDAIYDMSNSNTTSSYQACHKW